MKGATFKRPAGHPPPSSFCQPEKKAKDGAPLFIRLTPDEREQLQRRAAVIGIKPVEYVRRLILADLAARRLGPAK